MKRVFYGGFSLCLVAILAIVIPNPQNNLIPARMFLYMLMWVLILCGIRFLLHVLGKWLGRKGVDMGRFSRAGLLIYVIIYGIFLYIVSLVLRSHPVTDYGDVYETAYRLATGQAVEDWTYFSMWTNNLGPLTVLAFCMRLGVLLGFSDPYYFVLALNVLQVMAVMACIYYLAGRTGRGGLVTQWFAVLVFTLWTPVWASTNAFYSDQLSFGGSVIAIAALVYCCGRQGWKRWIAVIGAGFIWGISIVAKATSAIVAVALVIALIFMGKKGKTFWRELLVLGAAVVLAVGCVSAISAYYPSRADEYRLETPTEYWIALGLMEDGTYGANADFIRECNLSQNVDERREFCRQMIRENWQNIFHRKHMVDKTSVIFGDGSISPTSHIYPYKESLLWHWVYWEGDYFWKYACLATGFFYAVLLLMLMGTLSRTFRTGDAKAGDSGIPDTKTGKFDLTFMVYLTVFGAFLFLMLWEAQNKQLYNQIPWMTLAAVCGLEDARELILKVIGQTAGMKKVWRWKV